MDVKEFFKIYGPPVYFAYFLTLFIYTFLMILISNIAIGFVGYVFINHHNSSYVQELVGLGFDEQYFLKIFDVISTWMMIAVILFIIISIWSMINIKLKD